MRKDSLSRKVNMFLLAMLLVTIISMLSSQALGFGVGPSRKYINFEPGQTIEDEILIINDGAQDFKAAVYAQGDLASYFKIEEPLIDVASGEATKAVKYKLEFPAESPEPGEHTLEVVVRQFPADSDSDEGTVINTNMALISQLIVKVPYPGKYAQGKLFISGSDDLETPTRFTMMLYNFGTEDIENARMKVEVFGPTWEKIAEVESNSESLESKQEVKLEALWDPEVNKGTYRAVITVYYDDKQFKVEQNFDVGTFVIGVEDISVDKFTLGDVAKFDILLYNSWNTVLEDVYVEIVIEDSSGNVMTEFKTAAESIESRTEELFEAYWYTEGVAPGVYKVKLFVHYADKLVQKEYDFEVNTNSITLFSGSGGAVMVGDEEKPDSNKVLIAIMMMVIVLLLVMNVLWFFFLAKKLKNRGSKRNEKNDENEKGGAV